MGILDTVVGNVLDFLDRESHVDALVTIDEECKESEEQHVRRRAEVQQALEDMRRQERIMARRS